jgi:LPXTG-motif cell wall-anchored protein
MFMGKRNRWRFVAPVGAALLVAASLLSWAPIASAQSAGQPVEGLKGFATGQDLHATVLDPNVPQGGTRLVNADEAWSAAAVDAGAAGLNGAKLDEENRIFQPSKPGKLDYARGSGVEVGLGTTPTDPNTIILAGLAEAAAPPSSKKDTDLLGPLSASPLAYASATRGSAVANADESGLLPDVCVIGDDLSRGLGYAADAQLIDTGSGSGPAGQLNTPLIATDAPDGSARAVAQTLSHEFLVPSGAGDNNFGLASEVRETIAPVSILANEKTGVETLTIEVLGEWVLRAVATGHAGGASIFYGPGTVNPETPVLRILPSSGNPTVLKLQDLLGNTGLDIPGLDPIIHVTLGEAPRALAKPGVEPTYGSKPLVKADGTEATGAVDVLRVYSQALGIDVRLGHMEVSASAPAGGVNCPIPVTKTADPSSIKINSSPDTSHITMVVNNVFGCDLKNATLTDVIHKKPVSDAGDPDFQLTAAGGDATPSSPSIPTGTIKEATVEWNLGTIPKGTTKTVTLDLKSATSGGIIEDLATANGQLTNCTGANAAGVTVNGLSINNLKVSGTSVPVDVNVEIPRTGPEAKNTFAMGAGLVGLALAAGIAMRRRRGPAVE